MKKAVRLFLAFVLILTLVCSMVSVGFAKSISEGSWTVYDNSTTVLGNGGKLTYTTSAAVNLVTDRLYTGADADNDSKAFKLESGCYAQWPSIKISFNKNTLYTLSGYYYGEAIDGVQGMFSDAVIIKDGGGKTNKADHLSYLGRNDGYYLDENGGYTTVADRINSGVQAKKWNKIVLTFYSGENTSAVFALRPTVGNQAIYLDNLQLNIADIEANDWNMYDNSTAKIGTGGTLRPANQYTIIKTEEKIYSGEGADDDGTSIAVTGGFAQYVTRKIAVEKNKNYEYTLYYYSNSLNASGGIFSHALAMPDGGAKFDGSLFYMDANGGYCINAAGEKLTIKQSSIKNATAGAWNKVTISFNSGNLTEMLMVFRPTNQDVVYFDGFSLKEITKLPGVNMDNSDWKIYDFSTTIIGEGGKSTYSSGAEVTIDTENVYTGEGADNDGKAYCFSGPCYAQYVTQIKEFEANSYYKVTLYYKAAQLDDQGGIFSDLRMVRNGGEQNATSVDNLGAINRDRSYYTNKNGAFVNFADTIKKNVKANEWNKATFYFYSGNETKGLLTFRPTVVGGAQVYVDAVALTKVDVLKDSEKVPTGWTAYTMQSTIIGKGGSLHPTAEVEVTTDTLCKEDSDGEAFLLNNDCYAQYVTRKIEMEPNTYYNLSFWYYGTTLGIDDTVLSDVKLSKDGAENSNVTADNLGYLGKNSAYYTNQYGLTVTKYDAELLKGVEANKWYKVNLPFYSGELESALLTIRPVSFNPTDSTVGAPVYIDEISLSKTTEEDFAYANSKPFEGWGDTPRDTYVINFDDFYVPMDMSDRIHLSDAPEKDGRVTKAAHILYGQHMSATVPNLATVGSDTDPVFTVPVEESTKYSVSYSLYITKDMPTLRYFAFYYDFFYTDGTEDTTTIVRNSGMEERGEWVTFEVFFTTKPGQEVCSMIWNAGEINLDMYIDDITLRKIVPGVVYDAAETSYCEEFYNEFVDCKILDDIKAAKSGVYKIPVKKDVFYTLGLTASNQKGSDSCIYVSFDGVNPIPSAMADAPSAVITANKTEQRYGYDFVTDDSGFVYVVIKNDDGALKIKAPNLFFAYQLTKSENKGTKLNPNQPFAAYNGELSELWVLGQGQNEPFGESENPITGDNSVVGAVLVLSLTLLIGILALYLKKGGKQYEK